MKFVWDAVRGTAGLVGYFVRTFLFGHLIVDLVFGGLLAAVCFWIAYGGSSLRGIVAAVVALALSVVLGFVIATKMAIARTASRAIQQAALGNQLFDAIFARMLGVTEENPGGDLALTQALHGITVRDAQEKLNLAAADVLSHPLVEATVPRFVRWIATRIQRTAVWAIVRIVAAQWVGQGGADDTIDLLEVRDRLAGHVDGLIADEIRKKTMAVAAIGSGIVVVVACLVAWGVRQISV